MTDRYQDPLADAREHAWAEANMVDWTNGRMPAESADRMRDHLSRCAPCRADALIEEQIHARLSQQPVVEYAPQASFRRLMARIDSAEDASSASNTPSEAEPAALTATGRRAVFSHPWRWLGPAASAALILLVLGIWVQLALAPVEPQYRTLTSAPVVSDARLQIVFNDSATAADMRSALAAVRGHITDGPGFNGVFEVAIEPVPGAASVAEADWRAAEEQLASHPAVRFVTRVDPEGAS